MQERRSDNVVEEFCKEFNSFIEKRHPAAKGWSTFLYASFDFQKNMPKQPDYCNYKVWTMNQQTVRMRMKKNNVMKTFHFLVLALLWFYIYNK